jgi:hydroxymethylpyrimidine/phosphomethylpyrimidine kinase
MWNIDLMQIKQYYEKQVILRGGHIQERDSKEFKKMNMGDVLLYKNEYRIFKPVEIAIRRGLR